MSLHESTNVLLSDTEKLATWLNLADNYIQAFNDDRKNFVLPKAYGVLHPLIEAFANNLEGFVVYIKGVRDSLPRKSLAFEEVHALYRRVNGRYTQQVRRERTQRAVDKAEELYGKTDYHPRQKWISVLEHEWAQRRLLFLQEFSRGERVSMDKRAELLAEFWDMIDTEINEGDCLTKWN